MFFTAADFAGGKARAGKAQEKPAIFNPCAQGRLFSFCELGDIGQNNHVGVGRDHVEDGTFQQVCRR